MIDKGKSKQQLLEENVELRKRVATLEVSEIERQQTEEALRLSEVKYRRLYQSMMDAFVSVDMDGVIKEHNEIYCEMLGYESQELRKLRYMDITPEKWHSYQAKIIQNQVLQRGYSDIYEKEYQRKDGTLFPVELRTVLVKDDCGHPCGMWAIVRDITDRKRAEEELRKSHDKLEQQVQERTVELAKANQQLQREVEERRRAEKALSENERKFHDYFEHGLIGMAATAPDKHWLVVNDRTCEILGYAKEELYEKTWAELTHPEDVDKDVAQFQILLKGDIENYTLDKRFIRKDGSTVYTTIYIRAFRKEDGALDHIVALIEDISERKQAQEALQRQHHTLKHLLQSSDHERQLIAYEIHDELAQQLAGAIMQFQTYNYLKDNKPRLAGKAFKAGMTMLQQGHNETRRLIAGVRPPVLDESGVVEAIAHLVNEQNRHKGENIEYRSRVSFDRLVPTLESSIYRIAQEGLTNACQHGQSKRVRISLLQQEDWVRIEIRDWGVGFDPTAMQEKGFGLQGIQERARLLGGKCKISSSPGKGTRITVELPVVVREEET